MLCISLILLHYLYIYLIFKTRRQNITQNFFFKFFIQYSKLINLFNHHKISVFLKILNVLLMLKALIKEKSHSNIRFFTAKIEKKKNIIIFNASLLFAPLLLYKITKKIVIM